MACFVPAHPGPILTRWRAFYAPSRTFEQLRQPDCLELSEGTTGGLRISALGRARFLKKFGHVSRGSKWHRPRQGDTVPWDHVPHSESRHLLSRGQDCRCRFNPFDFNLVWKWGQSSGRNYISDSIDPYPYSIFLQLVGPKLLQR